MEYLYKEYESFKDIPDVYKDNTKSYRISGNRYVMKKNFKKKNLDFIKGSLDRDEKYLIQRERKDVSEVLYACLQRKFVQRTGVFLDSIPYTKMDYVDMEKAGKRRVYIYQVDSDIVSSYFTDSSLQWMNRVQIDLYASPKRHTYVGWAVQKVLAAIDV